MQPLKSRKAAAGPDAAAGAPPHTPIPRKLVPRPKTAAERSARLQFILRQLDQLFPNATCALEYKTPWQLLVATILSAQSTDKRVNEVTPGLFRKYPTIEDFAHASQAELERDIHSTGFYKNKAKSVIGAAKKVLADYCGRVPKTMEEFIEIPGAGRKTANVVLGTAYGVASGVVVDTHVTRVAQRLDLTKHDDAVKIEQDLVKILPQDRWILFSHQVILFGRAICIARKPKCNECPLDPVCYAKDKQA